MGNHKQRYVPRERFHYDVEVHVAGICVDLGRGAVLLAKRLPGRELYPGKYEGCGGQLIPGETFQEGVKRHFSSELDIEVEVHDIYELYSIETPGGRTIPGIHFLCTTEGAPRPKSNQHSEVAWFTLEALDGVGDDLINGIASFVLRNMSRLPQPQVCY